MAQGYRKRTREEDCGAETINAAWVLASLSPEERIAALESQVVDVS
jgi:hypothetical protein